MWLDPLDLSEEKNSFRSGLYTPLREFTGVVQLLKNKFLRQIETPGWPFLTKWLDPLDLS